MVPLSEQDPAQWSRPLIEAADRWLEQAWSRGGDEPRLLQAAVHAAWCERRCLADPPPWPAVLDLYDTLLEHRDDAVVRLNRAVALAEVEGPEAALEEVEALVSPGLSDFAPYHALCADLLRRVGRVEAAREAYAAVLALDPPPAERLWLERRMDALGV